MHAEYLIEDVLESTDDFLNEFMLAMADLPFGAPICIFSETSLDSAGLDMAEVVVKRFVFAISLLDTTMYDSSMRERSDVNYIFLYY